MKITIDTNAKTAIVHGEATFKEIESFLRIIAPESWNSYRLTCQNVSIADYGTVGQALQKQAMIDGERFPVTETTRSWNGAVMDFNIKE